MLLRIHHDTTLCYTEPVSETVFEVRMAPPSNEDQTSLGYRLRITPAASVTSYRDGHGNRIDLFNLLSSHNEVAVRATSYVRTHRRDGFARLSTVPWTVGQEEQPIDVEALEFLWHSPLVDECPEFDEFRNALGNPTGTVADVAKRVVDAVRERLVYETAVTTARTPVSEALALGRGVCQDFVHLFLAACRGVGLPARYVSGYVNQTGELATHAWAQVWGGETVGWVDIDPTRRSPVDDDYVLTAVGRDYSDVPPNRGLWRGKAEESISVAVKVEPVDRVPMDWNELSAPIVWSNPESFQVQRSGSGSYQMQRQGRNGNGVRNNGYRHQQGQQQQHQWR